MNQFEIVSEKTVDAMATLAMLLDVWEALNNSYDAFGNETAETARWQSILRSDFDALTEAEFLGLYKVAAFWEAIELDEIEAVMAPERILART